MGPKKTTTKETKSKKEKEDISVKPKLPEFPTKSIAKLKEESKERNCFSLIIHPEHAEEYKTLHEKKWSVPDLPTRQPRIHWPPLDIFTPVDDWEVPRVTIWKPITKVHISKWKYSHEEEILDEMEEVLPPHYTEINKYFTKTLCYTVYKWTQFEKYNDKKTSSILGMYLNTHNYFIGSTCRDQKDVYEFFKESILLHTVDDPPKSARILEPHECKAGLLYFCYTYLPILPLLRVQLLPNYRLRLLTHDPTIPPSLTPPVEKPLPSETNKKDQQTQKK